MSRMGDPPRLRKAAMPSRPMAADSMRRIHFTSTGRPSFHSHVNSLAAITKEMTPHTTRPMTSRPMTSRPAPSLMTARSASLR